MAGAAFAGAVFAGAALAGVAFAVLAGAAFAGAAFDVLAGAAFAVEVLAGAAFAVEAFAGAPFAASLAGADVPEAFAGGALGVAAFFVGAVEGACAFDTFTIFDEFIVLEAALPARLGVVADFAGAVPAVPAAPLPAGDFLAPALAVALPASFLAADTRGSRAPVFSAFVAVCAGIAFFGAFRTAPARSAMAIPQNANRRAAGRRAL